jgi:hypothetical protein
MAGNRSSWRYLPGCNDTIPYKPKPNPLKGAFYPFGYKNEITYVEKIY